MFGAAGCASSGAAAEPGDRPSTQRVELGGAFIDPSGIVTQAGAWISLPLEPTSDWAERRARAIESGRADLPSWVPSLDRSAVFVFEGGRDGAGDRVEAPVSIVAIGTRRALTPAIAQRTWVTPSLPAYAASLDDIVRGGRLTELGSELLSPPGQGRFLALVPAPARTGRAMLEIGGQTVRVSLLAPGSAAALRSELDTDSTFTAAQRERLLTRLRPLLDDPRRWWRLELIVAMRPDLLPDRLPAELIAARAAANDETRAFAAAMSARARAAIDRLAAVDADAAASVAARLAAIVTLPTGELAPAWSTDAGAERDLLRVLTGTGVSDARCLDSAQTWLRTQPRAALTVLDDAGDLYNAGRPRAGAGPLEPGFDPAASRFSFVRPAPSRAVRNMTVAVTELAGEPVTAMVASPGLSGSEAFDLKPFTSEIGRVDVASLAEARSAAVEVGIDRWSLSRETPALPIRVDRPGVKIGPLAERFTQTGFESGRADLPPREWWTAARLGRGADGRWKLFVEAARDPSPNAAGLVPVGRDTIEVWTGVYGRSGGPSISINAPEAGSTATFTDAAGWSVDASATGDRWFASVTLPETLTGGEHLLLGLVRRDGRGAVTAWPRPLLPGASEPGRRRFDIGAWPLLADEAQRDPGAFVELPERRGERAAAGTDED
jgi:hypothetical protein